jgi:hypothetical protein
LERNFLEEGNSLVIAFSTAQQIAEGQYMAKDRKTEQKKWGGDESTPLLCNLLSCDRLGFQASLGFRQGPLSRSHFYR